MTIIVTQMKSLLAHKETASLREVFFFTLNPPP